MHSMRNKESERPLGITLCATTGLLLGSYLVIADIVVLIIVLPVLGFDLLGMRSFLNTAMFFNLMFAFLGLGLAISSYGILKGRLWSFKWIHLFLGLLIGLEVVFARKYGLDAWVLTFIALKIVMLVYINTPSSKHFLGLG